MPSARPRVVVNQRDSEGYAGVAAVDGTRCDTDPLEHDGGAGGKQRAQNGLHQLERQPTEGRDDTTLQLGLRVDHIEELRKPLELRQGQRGRCGRECLTAATILQCFTANFPTELTGNAQAMKVLRHAPVELPEIFEIVVRIPHRLVAQDPEKRCLRGMLFDDGFHDQPGSIQASSGKLGGPSARANDGMNR